MRVPTPITKARIISTFKKYRLDINKHGFSSIKNICLDIFNKIKRLVFSIDRYYLYKYDLKQNQNISIIKPKIDKVEMVRLFLPITIDEYERLSESGYDFRQHPLSSEYISGQKGTFVFYGILNKVIIYRSCLSTYCNGVYEYIYPAQLRTNGSVYQGFNETSIDCRNKGLYSWAQCEMFQFAQQLGFKEIIMLEPEDQLGPRKVQDRLGSKLIYESFCLRLLFIFNYRWNKALTS